MGPEGKIICALVLGLEMRGAEPAASLTVLLYNYTEVPRRTLTDAEAFAGRSYRAAGIEISWVECASSEEDADRFRACEHATQGRSPFLKVIPETMAAKLHLSTKSEDALGVALASSAYVLYSRVQETARLWGMPEYVILGRTLAHELGHVLLGENSHTRSGLMSPRFCRQDLVLDTGQFLFDRKQAVRLRELLLNGPPN
jgi:hypothetical protein